MCTEHVNDCFTTAFGEVDFDADTKAFFGDEDGRIVGAILENTKSFEIVIFVEDGAFGEAGFV